MHPEAQLLTKTLAISSIYCSADQIYSVFPFVPPPHNKIFSVWYRPILLGLVVILCWG